jgi:4,5-dihydroxyphthalate decarboxylase
VARLFPDSRQVQQEYYKRTGIFPIMHLVAIRRKLLSEHPWLAKAVLDAYSQSKTLSFEKMTAWPTTGSKPTGRVPGRG